jgi:hypothetical protein
MSATHAGAARRRLDRTSRRSVCGRARSVGTTHGTKEAVGREPSSEVAHICRTQLTRVRSKSGIRRVNSTHPPLRGCCAKKANPVGRFLCSSSTVVRVAHARWCHRTLSGRVGRSVALSIGHSSAFFIRGRMAYPNRDWLCDLYRRPRDLCFERTTGNHFEQTK